MDQRQALELAQSYKTLVSGGLPVKRHPQNGPAGVKASASTYKDFL